MEKHDITIYTTYISVDLALHDIFHAKVGKGGINILNTFVLSVYYKHICRLFTSWVI